MDKNTNKYHGIKILSEKSCEYHFGMVRLIEFCNPLGWIGENKTEKTKSFLRRFDNRVYWQCARKCRDTVWKIHTAVIYLSDYVHIFEKRDKYMYDGAPPEEWSVFMNASDEIPYHLDSLITYIRILADCIAFSVPFFYRTNKRIAYRSFREHRNWFLKIDNKFDPAYSHILENQTSWFEKIAGKEPQGIRDIVFHNFGTYQLGDSLFSDGKTKIRIELVSSKGVIVPEVTFTLEEIIHGFYDYLDAIYILFGNRIFEEISPEISKSINNMSLFATFQTIENIQDRYLFYPQI